jgi:hypothetical protein
VLPTIYQHVAGPVTDTWAVKNLSIVAVALAFIWLSEIGSPAQSGADTFETWSRPTVGSSGISTPERLPGFQENLSSDAPRHKDFTGRLCLTVSGFARPQTADPNLYDDVIDVENDCPQQIALQVCYYQSEDCIPMDVPGNDRKEAILGILPSTAEFRFEFREKY